MLTLGDNFSYQGAKPLDARLKYDTLAAMKAVADATMYEGCLAYCDADDKTYQWKSTNTVDSTTGRWREFSSGGGEDENAYHTTDTAETAIVDADYIPFYDTSASAKRKSLWSNIKSLLKTYFDSYYQKTLTAGTNISFSGTNNTTINASMPMIGTINRSDIYDTTEKVIGKWTDGRPIYQKVVDCGYGPNNTLKYVAHGISNLSKVIDLHVLVNTGSGSSFTAQSLDAASVDPLSNNQAVCYISGSNVVVHANMDTTSVYIYAVIKYTKTTDAANSYNYANENDYSTSEKIIGTWIDGKTLYQKTVEITMPTTSTNGIPAYSSISWSSLGMSVPTKVVEISGCIANTSSSAFRPINLCTVEDGVGKFTSCVCRLDDGMQLGNSIAAFSGMKAYITLKYTKT